MLHTDGVTVDGAALTGSHIADAVDLHEAVVTNADAAEHASRSPSH